MKKKTASRIKSNVVIEVLKGLSWVSGEVLKNVVMSTIDKFECSTAPGNLQLFS